MFSDALSLRLLLTDEDLSFQVMTSPMLRLGNEDTGPPWLRPLLKASFFVPCQFHGDSNKSECNLYCLDCMGNALCSYCLPGHKDHDVVQVLSLALCLYSHGKRISIESVGNSCVDSEVFVSQCDQSVGGVQIHRHLLHPNLHYQQRQDSVPQREAAVEARKGSHQRLRNLQPQPLGFLPVLLHWLQGWMLPLPLPNRFTPLIQIDLNVYRPLYIVVVVFSARRYEDGPRAHLHPPPQASPRADAWL